MIKGLAFLLFVVVAAALVGMLLYSLYRLVRRENDEDIQELERAAEECRRAAENLERKINEEASRSASSASRSMH